MHKLTVQCSAVDSAVVSASSLVGYNLLICKRTWSNVDYQVKIAKFYNDNTRLCCGTFWRLGSQGRLNDLLDTRTSSSDFRDTVVEVEISLGSYDGQFNSTILVSVDQWWEVPNFNASSSYRSPTPWIVKWVSRCGTTLPVQCQQPWRPPGKSQHDEG